MLNIVLSASKDSCLSKVWNFQKGFEHNFVLSKLCLKFSIFHINLYGVNLKLILRHNCHCNQQDVSCQYLFLSSCHWTLGMIFYFVYNGTEVLGSPNRNTCRQSREPINTYCTFMKLFSRKSYICKSQLVSFTFYWLKWREIF